MNEKKAGKVKPEWQLFDFQVFRIQLVPRYVPGFDTALNPIVSPEACHDGARRPAGPLRQERGISNGPVRVSAVDSERYLHSDVTRLTCLVRGFHYQVGPAETFQFVRGNIRRMGGRRADELRKTVGYLSPTAIPASAQADGIARHSSGRVNLTICEG